MALLGTQLKRRSSTLGNVQTWGQGWNPLSPAESSPGTGSDRPNFAVLIETANLWRRGSARNRYGKWRWRGWVISCQYSDSA